MTYRAAFTTTFETSVKELKKRYRHIADDLQSEIARILESPQHGRSLGLGARKARCQNSDANRGKSGGYRLIYFVDEQNHIVHFMLVYSKSDRGSITEAELRQLIHGVS